MKLTYPEYTAFAKLEELFQFVIGGDWGKDPEYKEADYELVYCIRGIEYKNWENDKGKTAALRKIKTNSLKKRRLRENDILIEISGGGPDQPVGRTILIDQAVLKYDKNVPKVPTNFLRLARPLKGVYAKYLIYYLKLFYLSGEIVNYQGGSNNLRNLKYDDFASILIPLLPLNEQLRIVKKIEELLSSLEKGLESLNTALKELKIYRQAVLKYAFEGKLTNKNVNGELPEGWKIKKLKEIVTEKDGLRRGPFGSAIKKEIFVADGYKIYEQGNAINDDPYRGKYFINEEKYKELINFKVIPADLIVSCSGVTLGRISEIPTDAKPGIINQALLRIRLKKGIISNKYFIYHFRAGFFQKKIFDQSQGTAMPNLIGIKEFKEIELLIPTPEEQDRIIKEIESRLSVCDKIEEGINQSLALAESLRQSILKKAFEGKLVPNDPNDEPAEKLLERIKAEREKYQVNMLNKK